MLGTRSAPGSSRSASPKSAICRRVRGEAPAAVAKQPGLERVEAHQPAARRARALVQHHQPGEALAVLVRREHLEARVGLLAAGVGADRAERGHAGAPEVAEGARVGAVLVPEGAAVDADRAADARSASAGPRARPRGARAPSRRRAACRRARPGASGRRGPAARGRAGRRQGQQGDEDGAGGASGEQGGRRSTLNTGTRVRFRFPACWKFRPLSPMTPQALIAPARLAAPRVLRTAVATSGWSTSCGRATSRPSRRSWPATGAAAALLRAHPARASGPRTWCSRRFVSAYDAMRATAPSSTCGPWLYRIAHNAALNALRDRGAAATRSSTRPIDGVERPDQAVERREGLRDVVAAVQALPERQRDAIVLRELEGRSYDEIAAELGVTRRRRAPAAQPRPHHAARGRHGARPRAGCWLRMPWAADGGERDRRARGRAVRRRRPAARSPRRSAPRCW